MILQALTDYYERLLNDPECDVAPPGFEKKAIPFLIVINQKGEFVGLRDTRIREGRKKTVREFIVPQRVKRTGEKPNPNLFWDHPGYVLGYDPEHSERALRQNESFVAQIKEIFPEPEEDKGVAAVISFFERGEVGRVLESEGFADLAKDRGNTSFQLEGETRLICQSETVLDKITKASDEKNAPRSLCLVTGNRDITARLHPLVSGVWGTDKGRGNIVAFKPPAFSSFGKKQGYNAPVGQRAAFAYTTALNTLLAKGSGQRIQVGDASTVFWARERHEFEDEFSLFLGEPAKGQEPDYGPVRSLLTAVRTGVLPESDAMPFYVLGLAPNAARISIRFWYEGSVRDLKEKIAQHFEDIEIERPSYASEYLSLKQLLLATTRHSTKHPFGNSDDIVANLGSEIFRAVITGGGYPRTLLQKVVNRVKAEQGLKNKKGKSLDNVTHARAALIKAFLVRETRIQKKQTKEVGVKLDRSNDNIGYVLGRLFAALERIQETAQPGLNKTIRDTYFSAATSSPLVVFKRLQELAIHHLAKIRNSGKSTVWLDKLMGEVMGKIPASGIPATLTLEDQGRFAVGYYHQRQDFFAGKNNEKGE